MALQFVSTELAKDRKTVLAAVSQDGRALKYATAERTRDREVVLVAVSQDGCALRYAAAELRGDRGVVLAAVSQAGHALEYAAEELTGDSEIVSSAVAKTAFAYRFAADKLIQDASFAAHARRMLLIFKITLLSGRSCYVTRSPGLRLGDNRECLLRQSCKRLGMERTGNEELLHGTDFVPADEDVENWPGSPSVGIVTEYQLVTFKRQRVA